MPTDPRFLTPADFVQRAFEEAAPTVCGCAVCRGQAIVVDSGAEATGLSYLNADQRSGAIVNGKASFSIDRAALQLTGFDEFTMEPAPGWGGVAGRAFTVTYAFRANAPERMPDDTQGFQRFNATQIRAAEEVMAGWSDVARITFQRVGSGEVGEAAYSDQAAILFGNYSSGASGSAAFANFPGSTNPISSSGDVWVNVNSGSNAIPTMGNYGFEVLLHEVGHAIGLTHPGDYDASADSFITYQNSAEYYEDTRQYTVMSYFDEDHTGANYRGRFAAAPQLDDIRAAQIEYGANMTTRTGDTVYGFNSNAGRDWFVASSSSTRLVFAVWDAGGNDTFDFSGYSSNQLVDLREGFFSNVGSLVGNVAVAQGARIENALGGFGDDTVNGNELANRIDGGSGADRVFAAGGNDTIVGGSGSNYLRGGEGDDTMVGGALFDDIQGNQGNDTESGGAGDDWVVGGKDNDKLFGDDGHDVLNGNLGNDTADGAAGIDIVRGGQGEDSLSGGSGDDLMFGDRGSDTMRGGEGADRFFDGGPGVDIVLDFSALQGDRVAVGAATPFSVAQVGADVVVTLATAADKMILQNVQLSELPEGWIFTV